MCYYINILFKSPNKLCRSEHDEETESHTKIELNTDDEGGYDEEEYDEEQFNEGRW